MAIKVTIGRWTFPTKKAALAEVRRVLHNSVPYEMLEGDDYELILALVKLHRNADEKFTGGCIGIRVQWNCVPGYAPARGFHIVRADGTTMEFSIYCGPLDQQDTEAKRRWARLTQAARYAVVPTTQAYKDRRFGGGPIAICDVTGQILGWDDAVVDHAPPWPFRRILNDWLSERGVPPVIEQRYHFEFAPDDAAAFRAFHDERARLRLIDKDENMRLGAHRAERSDDSLTP
jgi:hypothetical protein